MELTSEENLFNGDFDAQKITCDPVRWKAGKDITIEKTKKKVTGGGAKKNKQKGKETIEPRDSFFRRFLCSYEKGKGFPEQVACLPECEECDEEDEEAAVEELMDDVLQMAFELKMHVIPYATRWYTGEAAPDGDDDDEDEEEEEEDEDSDEDDESPKGKKTGKLKAAQKGSKGKGSPSVGPAGNPKQEECKQQ